MIPTSRAVLVALGLAVFAPAARAQQGPDLGSLSLSFHPTASQIRLNLLAGGLFDVYLRIAVDFTDLGQPSRNATDGVKAWEACLDIPPEVTVLNRVVTHPSFNGADDSCDENWQMVLEETCLYAKDTPVNLIRYRCRLDVAVQDVTIGVGGASPSSITGDRPGWFQCASTGQPTDLHAFASGYNETLIINSSVAAAGTSWSTLKIRY